MADALDRLAAADEAAVRALLEAQRIAWNAGDLDGFLAGYARTDALVFTAGGAVLRGWQATRDRYLARFGTDRSSMGQLDHSSVDPAATPLAN